ncbi:MAG: RNA-guided endonuclease IscB [Candidatus Eremiobacterota bacterium]
MKTLSYPQPKTFVYVQNKRGLPLMPTSPGKARRLLKEGKAEIVKRSPFTIRLTIPTGETLQPVTLGVDSGYNNIGLSAITENIEIFRAEVRLRDNIVKLNSERRHYRKARRSRKTWYRKSRILNRKKPHGWLAPSIQHKMDSHIRIINKIKEILPIDKINIEIASFDIQKIKNPNISSTEYQNGKQKNFWNEREYVLYRDHHTCRHCKGKTRDPVLEVHHIISRKTGGNRPDNLITLCSTCHKNISLGKIKLDVKISKAFKVETFMSTVRKKLITRLKEMGHNVSYTYGYITKCNRVELNLQKSHATDAFVIAGGTLQKIARQFIIKQNRRNNRSLQLNRKGYKPAIRRKRYPYQPDDLVQYNNTTCIVKGVFNYGKWIRVKDIKGNTLNLPISKVQLLKYRRGFVFEN